jgi:hypothetical protein
MQLFTCCFGSFFVVVEMRRMNEKFSKETKIFKNSQTEILEMKN